MDLKTAKSKFINLSENIKTDADRNSFICWLRDEVLPKIESETEPQEEKDACCSKVTINKDEAEFMLDKIADDIRPRMPVEAVMPSETIMKPEVGDDAGLDHENTTHLDAFLYDEAREEMLVQEGVISRAICCDCESRNVVDLTMITHSCSKERLEHIFCSLLPALDGMTVVDIGSRIGAVLYGAYFYSKAAKIVGVEMNKELCQLQKEIISQHKLNDRICVLEGDILNMAGVLKKANVVVMNNVFDWFLSADQQVVMWEFLHRTLPTGCLMVTIPSLETSLKPLKTKINLNKWVKALDEYKSCCSDNQVETSEISCYKILDPFRGPKMQKTNTR